jgi:hypothetical protein
MINLLLMLGLAGSENPDFDKIMNGLGKYKLGKDVFFILAPTGKSVGSWKVTKFGTDGFTRRSTM